MEISACTVVKNNLFQILICIYTYIIIKYIWLVISRNTSILCLRNKIIYSIKTLESKRTAKNINCICVIYA